MHKRRMPLSSQELENFDVKMIMWRLKKKYFKDLVGQIERPKKYTLWYIPSRKEISLMVEDIAESLGIDLNDPQLQ